MDRIRLWVVGGAGLYGLATLAWCLSNEVSGATPGLTILLVVAGMGTVIGAATTFGVRLLRATMLEYPPVPDTPEDDYDDLPRTPPCPDRAT